MDEINTCTTCDNMDFRQSKICTYCGAAMPGSETAEEKHPVRKLLWSVAVICLILAFKLNDAESPETVAPVETQIEYETISDDATSAFMKNFKETRIDTDIEYSIDPALTDDEKILIYRNVDLAVRYLNSEFLEKRLFIVVFSDRNWGKEQLLSFDTAYEWRSQVNEDFGKSGNFASSCEDSSGSTGMAYGFFAEPVIAVNLECAYFKNSNGDYEIDDPDVFSHEITHVAQQRWFGSNASYRSCYMPRWFSEGQAQFVSAQISTFNGDLDPQKFRDSWLNFEPNGSLTDDENYETDSLGAYSDGAIAIEYLVGKHGWKKMEQLMALLAKRSTDDCAADTGMSIFSPAFKSVYKQSITDFYNEVRPYIEWDMQNF